MLHHPGLRRLLQITILVCAGLLATLGIALAAKKPPPPKFKKAHAYPVGSSPAQLAAGDLNGDGKPDLVTTNFSPGAGSVYTASVYAGGKKGKFSLARTIAVPDQPDGVAIGELAGDTRPDLVIGGYSGSEVLIYKGAGGFATAPVIKLPLAGFAREVVIDDFDGDGIADIATHVQGPETVSVFRGLASGGFAAPVTLTSGAPATYIEHLTSADVNGDGRADLLCTRSDEAVLSWLGGAGGSFSPVHVTPVSGDYVTSLTTGDFDGDGRADFAIGRAVGDSPTRHSRGFSASESHVSVYRGSGKNTFKLASDRKLASPHLVLTDLAAADFDRDGRDDIAGASFQDPQAVVMRGRKKAKLTGPYYLDTTGPSYAVAAARLDRNKSADVAVSGDLNDQSAAGRLRVFLQKKHKKH